MKKLIVALGCMLAIMAGSVQAKDWSHVRIAFDVPYKPFEYKNPDGSWGGFEVDLANAVCKEINAKCQFIVQSWDGIIPGLLARKYDAIMSSMSITPERAKKVLFSKPYYNTPSAWFAPKSTNIDPTNKAAMKGKIVGVQRGTTQDGYVTKNLGDVVQIKRYTTADDLVLDLQNGRLDMVLLDYPVGQQTIMKNNNFHIIGKPVKLGSGVGVAFRKSDKDLAAKFNKALAKLKSDGTYDKIMKKYFDYSIKM